MSEPVLLAAGLHKRFREGSGREAIDVTVLSGLSLTVQRAQTLAVVGASGSGKSTLLHLLGGLDKPTAGSVQLMGRDFASLDPSEQGRWRNRHLGFVYQFHHLLPEFSALENVAMPLTIRRAPDGEARERDALALAAGKLAGHVVVAVREPDALEHRARLRLRIGRRHAADRERHRDVLDRGELRQQVVELVDEAERPVAHAAALGLVERRERASFDRDVARGRIVEAADEVQQRALARARRADDRHALAVAHVEVDAVQHDDVLRTRRVGLLQATARNDWHVTHIATPPRD